MRSTFNSRERSGQAMLIAVLSIGGALLGATTIAGLLTLFQLRAASNAGDSAKAIFAADAGAEWTLFNYYCNQSKPSRCPAGSLSPAPLSASGATFSATCYDATGNTVDCGNTTTAVSANAYGTANGARRAFLLNINSAPGTPPENPGSKSPWPRLAGTVGGYSIRNVSEIADLAADGLTTLVGGLTSQTRAEMQKDGVALVDSYPAWLITTACKGSSATSNCHISPAGESTLLAQLKAHLVSVEKDPLVVAFWILDDYPQGDVSATLKKMHDLISASNQDAGVPFARPAICGFGGSIRMVGDTNPQIRYFDFGLTNFSPEACDSVAVYPYATSKTLIDASAFDWTMTYLLPAMKQDLVKHGWDPAKEPLIGVPQAFGYSYSGGYYIAPREADLATQMEAYCKGGAFALLAYPWHDTSVSSDAVEPYNSAAMRKGLAEGLSRCKSVWAAQ